MSCLRCGGILAAELTVAMYGLVAGKSVIEGPHCHCDEVDGPTPAHSGSEKKDICIEVTDAAETVSQTRQRLELALRSKVMRVARRP